MHLKEAGGIQETLHLGFAKCELESFVVKKAFLLEIGNLPLPFPFSPW